MEHSIGQVITLRASFTTASGLSDPDVVRVFVKLPDGTTTPYVYLANPEVVRESIGKYHLKIRASQHGTHRHRWVGEWGEDEAAADEDLFRVKKSRF
jgi:hypothetical protein